MRPEGVKGRGQWFSVGGLIAQNLGVKTKKRGTNPRFFMNCVSLRLEAGAAREAEELRHVVLVLRQGFGEIEADRTKRRSPDD